MSSKSLPAIENAEALDATKRDTDTIGAAAIGRSTAPGVAVTVEKRVEAAEGGDRDTDTNMAIRPDAGVGASVPEALEAVLISELRNMNNLLEALIAQKKSPAVKEQAKEDAGDNDSSNDEAKPSDSGYSKKAVIDGFIPNENEMKKFREYFFSIFDALNHDGYYNTTLKALRFGGATLRVDCPGSHESTQKLELPWKDFTDLPTLELSPLVEKRIKDMEKLVVPQWPLAFATSEDGSVKWDTSALDVRDYCSMNQLYYGSSGKIDPEKSSGEDIRGVMEDDISADGKIWYEPTFIPIVLFLKLIDHEGSDDSVRRQHLDLLLHITHLLYTSWPKDRIYQHWRAQATLLASTFRRFPPVLCWPVDANSFKVPAFSVLYSRWLFLS
jgi:hypothetical protein